MAGVCIFPGTDIPRITTFKKVQNFIEALFLNLFLDKFLLVFLENLMLYQNEVLSLYTVFI